MLHILWDKGLSRYDDDVAKNILSLSFYVLGIVWASNIQQHISKLLFHWLSKDANVLHCNTINLTSNIKIYIDSNQRQDKECVKEGVKNSIWCWRHQTTEGCSWSTLRTAGSSPPERTWDSSPGSSGGHRRWRIWGKQLIFHHEIYSRVFGFSF